MKKRLKIIWYTSLILLILIDLFLVWMIVLFDFRGWSGTYSQTELNNQRGICEEKYESKALQRICTIPEAQKELFRILKKNISS